MYIQLYEQIFLQTFTNIFIYIDDIYCSLSLFIYIWASLLNDVPWADRHVAFFQPKHCVKMKCIYIYICIYGYRLLRLPAFIASNAEPPSKPS